MAPSLGDSREIPPSISDAGCRAASDDPWGVIRELLFDLTHAFDSLRLENELLRAQVGAGLPAAPGGSDERQPPSEMAPSFPARDASGFLRFSSSLQTGAKRPMTREASGSEPSLIEAGSTTPVAVRPSSQGQLRSAWDPATGGTSTSQSTTSRLRVPYHSVRTGDVVKTAGPLQPFMLSPHSKLLAVWDLLSCAALGFDLFLAPLSVFGFAPSNVYTVASATFWTADMGARFFVGYYNNAGALEMRPGKVMMRYLKSFFVIDIVFVLLDWWFLAKRGAATTNKLLRFNKAVRLLRLFRVLRLLRLVKMLTLFESFERTTRSVEFSTAVKVIKKIMFIIVVNHFIACAWFGLSTATVERYDLNGWSRELRSDRENAHPSAIYMYVTALHWALTQFTPASMEVHARNAPERIFTMVVMICAMLAFSSVVASMTTTMTQLRQKNAEHQKQKEFVARFMSDHHISVGLGLRINGFINREEVRTGKRPVLESEVSLIPSLPVDLRKEIHVEMFDATLLRHPVFLEMDRQDKRMMESVCHTAMQDEFFRRPEAMCSSGDAAAKMFFVVRGSLHFVAAPEDSEYMPESSPQLTVAKAGDMLSEQALWLDCSYSGSMVCTTDVFAFTLNSTQFGKLAQKSAALPVLLVYARLFLEGTRGRQSDLICDLAQANEWTNKAFDESGMHTLSSESSSKPGPPSKHKFSRALSLSRL